MSTLAMFSLRAIVLFAVALQWSHGKLDRYCSLCEDHTMCRYQGLGKECVKAGGSGVSESERREIVDVHNWLRRIVGSGYETRGSGGAQPKAANLRKLFWDEDLASVAQRWADQCLFRHDTCRNDPRWKVGQNIYWKYKYPNHQVNWTEAILSWYNEVSLFNPHEVDSYRFESATGHYTQMLWHDTFAIGCGRRDYGDNKLYVCNYGPAGNWLGEPLYTVGEPCSHCPQGTRCEEYLCVPSGDVMGEANGVRSTAEADLTGKPLNESTLEGLYPPRENSQSVYASEGEKGEGHAILNRSEKDQIAQEHSEKELTYVLLELDEKTTTNSIQENDIQLDEDTKHGVQKITSEIEDLLKNLIKKLNRRH